MKGSLKTTDLKGRRMDEQISLQRILLRLTFIISFIITMVILNGIEDGYQEIRTYSVNLDGSTYQVEHSRYMSGLSIYGYGGKHSFDGGKSSYNWVKICQIKNGQEVFCPNTLDSTSWTSYGGPIGFTEGEETYSFSWSENGEIVVYNCFGGPGCEQRDLPKEILWQKYGKLMNTILRIRLATYTHGLQTTEARSYHTPLHQWRKKYLINLEEVQPLGI